MVYSGERQPEKAPQIGRETFSGTYEVQLKFFVPYDQRAVPSSCIRSDLMPIEKSARALQHEKSPGNNFIKNAQDVSPLGIVEGLLAEGYGFKEFSHHYKDETLHNGGPAFVVQVIFSKESNVSSWDEGLLQSILDRSWACHCWKNASGIMTLNMVRHRKQPAKMRFVIEGGRITMKPIEG